LQGEPLADLEAALEFLVFEAEECGCIPVSGAMPKNLDQVLMRALTTIDAELEEQGLCACIDENYQPMRQLSI
jgi:hypothetical protein